MKYFLIGIKGSAMSALARILNDLGNDVYGVDYDEDYYTTSNFPSEIKILGLEDMIYDSTYYYVIGNAFVNHSITKNIIDMDLIYEYYPHFLNALFDCVNVAISGTHGKTTTTKMLSCLTDKGSYLIGDGSGKGREDCDYFFYEACEYKDVFLNYFPDILLVMNIDFDHPDYFNTVNDVFDSFSKASEQSRMLIYNGDDKLASKLNVFNRISFGFDECNDVVVKSIEKEYGYDLTINYFCNEVSFKFPFYGKHMVYDFLGAYTVLRYLGFGNEEIINNIKNITLPHRRMETVSFDNIDVICDYAHHPNEILSFYNGLDLKYKNYNKIIIFEPHTNSRTLKFKRDYKRVLNMFDEVYLTDIFTSVREKNDDYLQSQFFDFMEMKKYSDIVRDSLLNRVNSVICFVGAGNIDKEYQRFISYLKNK